MRLRYLPVVASATAVITALIGVAPAAHAAAGAAPPPAVSIELADGQSQVHSDQDVTYTVQVINSGSSAVPGQIEISVPDYVELSRDGSGKVTQHLATWSTKVRAGETLRRSVHAHIGSIAKGELRVTALASMYAGRQRSAPPLVRTADADRIAGVDDPARSAGTSSPAAASSHAEHGGSDSVSVGWWIGGAAVVLAGLVAALWPWLRRRNRGAHREASDEELVASGPHGW